MIGLRSGNDQNKGFLSIVKSDTLVFGKNAFLTFKIARKVRYVGKFDKKNSCNVWLVEGLMFHPRTNLNMPNEGFFMDNPWDILIIGQKMVLATKN